MARQEQKTGLALPMLQRFSFTGQWSVMLLLAGGISTFTALVAAWNVKISGLQLSGYTVVFSIKLALLAIMLAIAAMNRFIFMRQLERRSAGVFLLQRMVLIECVLGVLIIAASTVLGSQAPPAA
jgi:copper transport protein